MSFPAYLDSKPTGDEWLEDIPAHWNLTPVRRLVVNGVSNGLFKKKDEFGQGTLLVNVFDVYQADFMVKYDRLDRVSCTDEEIDSYGVLPNDLFFVRSSLKQEGVAVVCVAGECHEPVVYECHLVRARPDSAVLDGRFTSYVLNSAVYRAKLIAKAKVTTMTTIDQESIVSTRIPVPPLNEQKAISSFLDVETSKIDGLVSEQRRLIELLKEKRQAVISHAVTKGLNPNASMKPSGIQWLGDVPEHWKIGRCGYYVSILSGYAFPSTGFSDDESNIRLLRGINVGVSEIKWDETVYWERNDDDGLDRFELKPGDLVIGMDRPWISSGMRVAKISEMDLPCLLLQRVAAISTDNRLHTDFLWHLLSSEMFVAYFEPETTGVSVPHISPTQIEDFEIPVPPIEEQNQIVEHVLLETGRMDTLLAEAERAIELLRERRTALISAAVTGKIDVRAFASKEAVA